MSKKTGNAHTVGVSSQQPGVIEAPSTATATGAVSPAEGPTAGPVVADMPAATIVASAPDPFDPERLRLSQDFSAAIGVKKALLTVPVRKPSREWWIRVHPDEAYRIQTGVLELKEGDREVYLVEPKLWPTLSAESLFGPRLLATAVNRQGVVFLWPVRLPGPDGRIDDWSRSALEAVGMAQHGWVRVASNMALGAYEVFQTSAELPPPVWPELPLGEILRIAFKDKLISTMDHPVLRKLRGEQ